MLGILEIMAAMAGIAGFVMSIITSKKTDEMERRKLENIQAEAFLEFLKDGDSAKQKSYRRTVYNLESSDTSKLARGTKEEIHASNVVSFYDKWATAYLHDYLPKWAFDDSTGFVLCKMYEILDCYIKIRCKDNHDYGKNFGVLYSKLKSRYVQSGAQTKMNDNENEKTDQKTAAVR